MLRSYSRKLSLFVPLYLLSFACGGNEKSEKVRDRSTDSSLVVKSSAADKRTPVEQGEAPGKANDGFYEDQEDSPAMTIAFFEARARVGSFVAALSKPKPAYSAFAVKVRLTKDKVSEDIWLNDVVDRKDILIGKLNNEPKQVKGFKMGEEIQVYKDDILDWMYIDDKVLVGGFTIRVLRDGMSAQERAAFDRRVSWRITERIK